MPLYEYSCSDCGDRLERRQRFDDAPLRDCPNCGGQLSRLIHPVGIVFKGSGWYSTDHRSTKGLAMPAEPSKETTDTDSAAKPKESKKEDVKAATTAKE